MDQSSPLPEFAPLEAEFALFSRIRNDHRQHALVYVYTSNLVRSLHKYPFGARRESPRSCRSKIKHRRVLPHREAYIYWFKCRLRIRQVVGFNFSTAPAISHRWRLLIGCSKDSTDQRRALSSFLVARRAMKTGWQPAAGW